MIAAISKWGNSSAIRIPKHIMQAANLTPSDKLEINVTADSVITLRRVTPTKAERFMELYGDYQGDWRVTEEFDGVDVGNEVVE